MGSQIEIRCAEQLYRAEKAKVEIVVNFDRPTKVRCIHATFIGREKADANYTETKRDSDGKRRTVTKTATEYCLLYTSPSPRDQRGSRMPSSA